MSVCENGDIRKKINKKLNAYLPVMPRTINVTTTKLSSLGAAENSEPKTHTKNLLLSKVGRRRKVNFSASLHIIMKNNIRSGNFLRSLQSLRQLSQVVKK
jgi:hypothetical protein